MKRSTSPKGKSGQTERAAVVVFLLAQISSAWLAVSVADSTRASPLVFFSLLPLFVAICLLSTSWTALCGLAWGLTAGTVLTISAGEAGSFTLIPALISGVAVSGFALVSSRVTRRFGFNPLFLATLWVLVEAVREPFVADGGILSSASLNDWTTDVVSSILGYAFVGFVVTLVNGLFVQVALCICRLESGTIPWAGGAGRGGVLQHTGTWLSRRAHLGWPRRTRAPPLGGFFPVGNA